MVLEIQHRLPWARALPLRRHCFWVLSGARARKRGVPASTRVRAHVLVCCARDRKTCVHTDTPVSNLTPQGLFPFLFVTLFTISETWPLASTIYLLN